MSDSLNIPGYSAGTTAVAASPVTLADFALMRKSVLFDDQDIRYLRLSHEVLKDQVEAILDVWYGFVGANPHLLAAFCAHDGQPLGDYLGAVRRRFGQWILDTARAEYDQRWLDYQHEIGLRHHRSKKNRTDGAAASAIVPFRDLFLLIYPITFTLRPFLAKAGHSAEDVEKMHAAWLKSCLLQVTLWSRAYVNAGDF
ncbi:protogloblin ApPgb [Pseudomonas cavernae]|uniref:Protogloblin ApPgb n=1 Tax=Pseudomonas cavernae TaxID=2320867 RepID=A0A385YZ20_9PSED|nr:protoglobin domain-containing protein [Pseudomonas cavernae]AYC32125.1 protogloblin ApPgb [Pseudomonas cavernae]